jgi:hypothetical protein
MPVPVNIAIITSTAFGPPPAPPVTFGNAVQAAFQAGLNLTAAAGVVNTQVIFSANNNYYDAQGIPEKNMNQDNLYSIMNTINNITVNPPHMIVSLGGLVTAHAVTMMAQKPFLVVIGQIPKSDDFVLAQNNNYYGGVNLNTTHDNVRRRQFLATSAGIPLDSIWLLHNPNARMSMMEVEEWRNGHRIRGHAAAAAVPGGNDSADFAVAFTRLRNATAQGIVVSADPFFTNSWNAFVTAANNSTLHFCYPFQLYNKAQNPPTAGQHWYYGLDLLDAYTTLGKMAGNLATSIFNTTPLTFQGLGTAALQTGAF